MTYHNAQESIHL